MSRYLCGAVIVLAIAAWSSDASSKSEENEKLNFLVGEWSTVHEVPTREGETVTVSGEASIQWSVGGRWLRHDFQAEFPGRGDVFTTHMMNYSPTKMMYNAYMFDHFGGEAGAFYGDWIDEDSIVVTARFEEDDGSESYQKFTLTRVSDSEIWVTRGFSDDGENYHFELKGVYSRKEG